MVSPNFVPYFFYLLFKHNRNKFHSRTFDFVLGGTFHLRANGCSCMHKV